MLRHTLLRIEQMPCLWQCDHGRGEPRGAFLVERWVWTASDSPTAPAGNQDPLHQPVPTQFKHESGFMLFPRFPWQGCVHDTRFLFIYLFICGFNNDLDRPSKNPSQSAHFPFLIF